jgi:hypothetical protein
MVLVWSYKANAESLTDGVAASVVVGTHDAIASLLHVTVTLQLCICNNDGSMQSSVPDASQSVSPIHFDTML